MVVAGNDDRARRRTEAFLAQAAALKLPKVPVHEVTPPTTLRSGRQALKALMGLRARPEGVFCSSDLLALGVMTEARAAGLKVPEDLAVVGFGDLDFAADTDPALTTVRINGAAIGRHAAQFIVDRAEGRAVAQPVLDIGFSIVDRQTT